MPDENEYLGLIFEVEQTCSEFQVLNWNFTIRYVNVCYTGITSVSAQNIWNSVYSIFLGCTD